MILKVALRKALFGALPVPAATFQDPIHLANGECCFVLSPCVVSCNPKDANATESFKSSSPRNKESQSIPARSLSFPFALHVPATLTKSLGGEWRLSTESPRGLLPATEQDIVVVVVVVVVVSYCYCIVIEWAIRMQLRMQLRMVW